ncbi:MAG TPA: GNAT family N-acetyltransferase [Gemmatimonadales bacterium]|nr:GNAT family N-acetyltransferase [Gemmatimonadales bacterium]
MSAPVRVARCRTDAEIARCWPVMAQLRPHVAEADFVRRVRELEPGGFRLAALEADGVVRAVAGYRIQDMLVSGRQLYVDDLVTDESSRSAGHGRALLAWLADEARVEGCRVLELDSGTWRHGAHRFYFREGMHILGFHFSKAL